ncbi:hypothetical protein L6452_19219 [Arctium lappa]|uniref:Uncharacterized protein n=1 Tax=Arctium lappa TaxID=4217 RepID=A0ACB9B7E8_ARCLA|nr:hypothetical protein L6452_19219 [Arctium lappa]
MSNNDYESSDDFEEEVEVFEIPIPEPEVMVISSDDEQEHVNPIPPHENVNPIPPLGNVDPPPPIFENQEVVNMWLELNYFRHLAAWQNRELRIQMRPFRRIALDRFMFGLHSARLVARGLLLCAPYIMRWTFEVTRLTIDILTDMGLAPYPIWLRRRYPVPHHG